MDRDDLISTLSTLSSTQTTEGSATEGERASLLLYHRDGAELVPLHEARSLVVGRARPADVPIRDRSLSRAHARFTLSDGALWVEDLESTNGTFVNGKRLRPGERRRAAEPDEVRLGAVTAVLHVLGLETPGGLESHDRVIEKVEQEVTRAQLFGRKLAVAMVRASERKKGHLSRWAQRVRQLLRPVDAIALYDATSTLIVLVESGREEAQRLTDAIRLGRRKGEPALLCGVACFPEDAASADELLAAARGATSRATEREPVIFAGGSGEPHEAHTAGRPIVLNPRVVEVYRTAARIAEAASPVLILGETGTGKEVLASEIHERSKRKGPLRCINCGAIPGQLIESALFGHERGAFTGASHQAKGVFEEASGGTVLLDEIGELSPAAQAALLRVIETRKLARVGSSREFAVDVRVLAATHRDLEQMCGAGEFRSDLFFRLNAISLQLPPLRERPEEILPLAEQFVREASRVNHCRVRRIGEDSARLLQTYSWPGNIRELRNVIERAVLIAQDELITADDLSERVRRGSAASIPAAEEARAAAPGSDDGLSLKDKLRRYESELLLGALKLHGWNQTRTAEALGMPLRTLVHKMQTLGLRKRFDAGE